MKTKPVVLHTGHQAIRDGNVVDAQYVDVAAFISRDSGNALTYADGLYYAAAPCHENSSYVIATDFFPIIAEDGYKVGGLRVTGIHVTGGKEETGAKDALTVAVEPLGGVLRRYGVKQHVEREAVSVDVEPLGGAVRRIGLITHEDTEAIGVNVEPLGGAVRRADAYGAADGYKTQTLLVKAIEVK